MLFKGAPPKSFITLFLSSFLAMCLPPTALHASDEHFADVATKYADEFSALDRLELAENVTLQVSGEKGIAAVSALIEKDRQLRNGGIVKLGADDGDKIALRNSVTVDWIDTHNNRSVVYAYMNIIQSTAKFIEIGKPIASLDDRSSVYKFEKIKSTCTISYDAVRDDYKYILVLTDADALSGEFEYCIKFSYGVALRLFHR